MPLNSLGKLLTQALVFLPGVRCHIIRRGNDRNSCLFDVRDVRKAVAFAVPPEVSRVRAHIALRGTVYLLESSRTLFPLAAKRYIDHIYYKVIDNGEVGACRDSRLFKSIVTQLGNRRRKTLD